jgi:hypothetical protein
MIIIRNVFVLLMLLAPASLASAGMTLVQDGKPNCAIVISSDAGDNEKRGANDLQLYLNKMSGAMVPLGTDASVAGNRILIGVFGKQPVKDWQGRRPASDGFAIQTRRRSGGGVDLLLVGGDERGAEYAAYELLERFLGVRWYTPDEVGEEVPTAKTIQLQDIKWSNKPNFEAVHGLVWPGNGRGGPGAEDWLRHNKGNVGSSSDSFGYNWAAIVKPSEENKKAHPEWFALQPDGTRGDQLCSSNPDVIRISVETARTYFEKNPDGALFSLSPNDGYGFCTCDRCKAIDAKYGVTDGSHTDRLIEYANAALAELKKTCPDKLIGIVAEASHTRPPVSAIPDANYATMISHTPWEFCHVHAINDPGCKHNTEFRQVIEGWAKVCKHVTLREYYGHYSVFTPWPITRDIAKDLPYMRSIGVTGLNSETQQNWANQGINFYLASKLVWSSDRSPGEILDDFYKGFYGPAEQPMRQYWEAWETAMSKQDCQGNNWLAMFNPDLMKRTGQLLDEAEKLAAGNDKVTKRLALNRIGYRYTQSYVSMLRYGRAFESVSATEMMLYTLEHAIAAGERACKIVQDAAGSEPQAFFTSLAVDQTRAQMLRYQRKLDALRPAKTGAKDPPVKAPQEVFLGEAK